MGITTFKIHREIHDKVTKFGLELYDWGIFIFLTMLIILILKTQIIVAILIDLLIFIFLKKYKKGKPDFYTVTLITYLFSTKDLIVLEPGRDKLELKDSKHYIK